MVVSGRACDLAGLIVGLKQPPKSSIKREPRPKMSQHVSTFRLVNDAMAARQVIPMLREYFETEAFRGLPEDAPYVESPLNPDAMDRLNPLLSLVYSGVSAESSLNFALKSVS